MAPLLIGPRCNRRVTCYSNPNNDRSESAIAADPNNPYHLVGSSKKFTDPDHYIYSLATYASLDGGQSWVEGHDAATNGPLKLLPGWGGTTDPAVAWDDAGRAFLIGLPVPGGVFPPGVDPGGLGLASYTSTDGGRTWSEPNFFHSTKDEDRQSAAGDTNPANPHHGNVYVVWTGAGGLCFARTLDHGATWIGTGAAPAGSVLASNVISGSDVVVAPDGTVYVVALSPSATGIDIVFLKSTDGGNVFLPPKTAASVTTMTAGYLPGGTFRTAPSPVACVRAASKDVVVAWPDKRTGVSRVFYVYTDNGGSSWHGGSGQQLLTGAVASAADQHEIQPQLASTPDGTIGCAFYQFGPKTPGGPSLIDVVLAAAAPTGKAASFADRVNVTDQPWDPAKDAPWVHGDPTLTFIGDYFGLTASQLGFHPLWVDTRNWVQEMYTSRLAVNPCDVYIRDSTGDTEAVPRSLLYAWDALDLIVRRQPDGFTTFEDQDLLHDGMTDHYVYARVTAKGPNDGRNVTVAVTVGNYPSLLALPGTEFRYPQDWYQDDWTTAAIQARHLYLGETPVVPTLTSGSPPHIVGPILWKAADILAEYGATWHPCLLAEVRADNNDSAGGINGCGIDADPDTCDYGEYFYNNNNLCQRNVSYAPVSASEPAWVHLPFLVGSPFARAHSLAVIVERDPELAGLPMTLRMVRRPGERVEPEPEREAVPALAEVRVIERHVVERLERHARVVVAERETDVLVRPPEEAEEEHWFGGERTSRSSWRLTHQRAVVGFPVHRGELRALVLSFETPRGLKPGSRPRVRIFQRNENRVVTGSVTLELQVGES